jgi:alpha-tubulin suppressor-like RCC1 family protein
VAGESATGDACASGAGGHREAPWAGRGNSVISRYCCRARIGLALRSDGIAFAWGHGQDSQLGNGTTANTSGQVQVTGLTIATQIAAGGASSFAARTVAYLLGS